MNSSLPSLSFLLLFAIIPASAQKDTPAIPGIAAPAKQAVETALASWKRDGGGEFKGGITYVKGEPILMLITRPGETPDQTQRRLRQMIAACDFLLDENAVAQAQICVVQADPVNSRSQVTANYVLGRASYQAAVKKAAGVADVKAAAAKAGKDTAVLTDLCRDLGFK